jgi:hypothetical protein
MEVIRQAVQKEIVFRYRNPEEEIDGFEYKLVDNE